MNTIVLHDYFDKEPIAILDIEAIKAVKREINTKNYDNKGEHDIKEEHATVFLVDCGRIDVKETMKEIFDKMAKANNAKQNS